PPPLVTLPRNLAVVLPPAVGLAVPVRTLMAAAPMFSRLAVERLADWLRSWTVPPGEARVAPASTCAFTTPLLSAFTVEDESENRPPKDTDEADATAPWVGPNESAPLVRNPDGPWFCSAITSTVAPPPKLITSACAATRALTVGV